MNLTFLFEATVLVGAPIELGEAARGRGRIIPILGGTVTGPRLQGRVLAGGADWQTLRSDGVAEIEARYVIESAEGVAISVHNVGLRHGPPEIMAKLVAGQAVPPDSYYFRTAPRFEVGDPRYAWLGRALFLCAGIREPDCVRLKFFEVG